LFRGALDADADTRDFAGQARRGKPSLVRLVVVVVVMVLEEETEEEETGIAARRVSRD